MNSIPSEDELVLVKSLYSALPLFSASFFLIAICVRGILVSKGKTSAIQLAWRWWFVIGCFVVAVLLSYVVDAIVLTLTSTPGARPPIVRSRLFYSWASSLFWFVNLLCYLESTAPTAYPFYGTWITYLAAELLLFWFSLKLHLPHTNVEVVLRTFRLFLLVSLLLSTLGSRIVRPKIRKLDEENTPLLTAEGVAQEESQPMQNGRNGETYGSCNSKNNASAKSGSQTKSSPKSEEDDKDEERSLWDILAFLRTLFPYFWPSGKPGYQLLYLGIGGCLIIERIMNIVIPLQLGLIANLLTKSDGTVPWREIMVFIALRLLQSSGGLTAIRSFMWVPLEDLSYQKVSTTAFNHIMSLSCDFHDRKVSGAVWQTIVRGQYVKDVVNHICFMVIPTVIDLILAVTILYYLFDAYMALITAAVTVLFLWTSGKIITRQRSKRKVLIDKRLKEFNILCESTGNWKTVSYFNQVPHEQVRYRSAVRDHMKSRVGFRFWNGIENTIQSFVLLLGLMAACFIAAYEVVSGAKPIGSFVMLLSYWAQLSTPLQSLANGFGDTVRDMVDAEELLDLLTQKPSITDAPDAKPLVFENGCIEFNGVKFSYDGKRGILDNVSFRASPGQTTAIVGKTGGGKSTILKLLCRFYDPVAGTINIDGQDISKVTLDSLRAILGIVPQDPVLFRDTIMANIRYARLDATDEEIVNACKAVALHDKIMTFPDGYDALVGERGMKLSGGELQRVAIARAMIKNPKVVLLDEATSSVDSETEAHVQKSLKLLCAGRTTIVIAHRLSTVMNADQILVVNDGEIVEKGTHSGLLKRKGYYYRLCSWQGFASAHNAEITETPALLHDIDTIEMPTENGSSSCIQTRPENTSNDSLTHLADVEVPDVKRPLISTSEVPPQPSTDQLELCEHCRRCFSGGPSAGERFKVASHPGRILKPEAPEFVPRAFQNYHPSSLHPYYKQVDANHNDFNQRYTADHPPSGYASDTGESVEIRTSSEKKDCALLQLKGKFDENHTPTCSLHNAPENDVNVNGVSLGEEPLMRNEENGFFNGEEPLSARDGNIKKALARRKLAKSEPAGFMAAMNGDFESLDRGSDESQASGHEAANNQKPRSKLSDNIPQHRRRRRRNNWRRRKEMRTNTSTQTGTSAVRSPSTEIIDNVA